MPKPTYYQPSQNTPNILPLQAPNPHPHPHPHNPQPTIIHTTVTTGGNCIWCRQGVVRNETDLCCLVCLIILAICTFPFGLVLLCCIPCTVSLALLQFVTQFCVFQVRPRCSHCRRLQD